MRRGLLLVALVSLVTSCATEADGLPFAAPAGESLTPRITTPDDQPRDLVSLLLTESDVDGLTGFANVLASDLADVAIFENPDPRGPCGAVVPQLDVDGLVARSFRGDRGLLVEFAGPLTPEMRAAFEGYRADSRPGCDDFESMTNTGDTQRVSDIDVLDLAGVADGAIASSATITAPGGAAEGTMIFVIEADRAAFVMLIAVARPSAEEVLSLARRVAERLA